MFHTGCRRSARTEPKKAQATALFIAEQPNWRKPMNTFSKYLAVAGVAALALAGWG